MLRRCNTTVEKKPFFTKWLMTCMTLTLSIFSLSGLAMTAIVLPAQPVHAATRAQAATRVQNAVTNPVPFGTQLGFEFVDLVKQSARFQQIGSAPSLTFDSAGWPQSDFEYIFLDDRRNMPWNGPDFNGVHRNDAGTYKLTFTGQATLVPEEDPNALQFQNVAYNSSTNTTTADVVLLPNHWLAAIGFTNTKRNPTDTAGNGLTNVSLLRPGYTPGTTQIFTSQFINAVNQMHPTDFRSFDNGMNSYNIWNGTTLVTVKWADRSLPSDAYWPLASRNSGSARGLAVPWEYYVLLANQLNTDVWINIPVGADDDYVTQLATLIKNGDQWTAGLNANLHVYVEYSNEVWNWSFSQATYNQNIANQEGISTIQRYVERSFQISDLFRNVYGASAMGTTIRPVALWQYNTELDMQSTLSWAQNKFGNPPGHYLYGIGEAPYVDPTEHGTAAYPDPADPNGVNRIMDTFYTSAGNRRRAFEQWQAVAVNFGLHEVGYESGPSLNAGIEGDVTRSSRMQDFIQRYYLNDYFATGADAVNFFAFGQGNPCPCGDWYSFEDYSTMSTYGKWLGVLGVAGQARPNVVVGNVLPWSTNDSVTIDASQYVNGGTFAAPGSQSGTCAGGCWPYPGSLDYLLRVPANGTYTLQLTGHTNNSAAQIQVQIDNATVNTVTLPQNTDGTVSVGSVTLTAGLHSLVLNGAGSGQTIFATNGGITFTLTSGGGSAIVPSAPINLISSTADGQVKLSWENVTKATGYTIERSTNSGGPYSTIGSSSTNSYTDSGLTNGTTYYYVVTANNATGSSVVSPQTVATPVQTVTPATPSNITAQTGGADSTPFNSGGQVRISWPAVANATSYNIKQYDSSSSSFKTIRSQTETIFYQDNLTVGTTYKYEISAVNSTGESANSAEIDLTPQESVPAAPTNLKVTAGSGQISLNWMQSQWQFPSFSFLFNVKRGSSASGPFTTIQSISTNNAVDLGLTNGTQYCYVVTAVNSKGESGNSQAVCATPTGNTLPSPWQDHDIGTVGSAGSASYSGSTFTVNGSGADIWGTSDAFNYVSQTLNGDGTIVARVASQQNTDGWAKAGVMIRETLNADATFVDMLLTPSNGAVFQYRTTTGGSASTTGGPTVTAPYWVKLVRAGSTFTGYASSDGTTWTQVGSTTISMVSSVYVGLAVTSHNNSVLNTSTFDNVNVTTGSSNTLPSPWQDHDIGTVGSAGSASYSGSTFTVNGSGADIWGTSDAFNYVSQTLNGDGTIVARVASQQNTDGWAKAGVMIRETLNADATFVDMLLTPSNGAVFQYRTTTGGSASTTGGPTVTAPYWVKLVRAGSTFTGYASSDGTTWTQVGSTTISMVSSVYVGLAVTSHNNSVLNTSTFDNVSVSTGGSTGASWTKCADEGGTCSFSGTMVVRYGANGQYDYMTVTGSIACSNTAFGSDPIPGTVKACYTAPVPPPGWTKCADENGTCNVPGTVTVAYGANGQFYYHTVTGSTACNNTTFGDPAVGSAKSCYYL